MDKAVIFGVFDFISFHVCKTLLEKGFEVKGIHIEDKMNLKFLEEKRFEVGRNANFVEKNIETIPTQELFLEEEETIIFSLYDFYMLYKEESLSQELLRKSFSSLIENGQKKDILIVFILPIQMLTNSMKPIVLMDLQRFMDQAIDLANNIQYIYLPSVYGPWQPETFLFQHTILTRIDRHEDFKGIREDTNDAIYIMDVMEEIERIIETRQPGKYLLESGTNNQWDKCAAFLNIDESLVPIKASETFQIDQTINKITMKKLTPIFDSINNQLNHVQRLYLK